MGRALRDLEADGLVERQRGGGIRILDEERLAGLVTVASRTVLRLSDDWAVGAARAPPTCKPSAPLQPNSPLPGNEPRPMAVVTDRQQDAAPRWDTTNGRSAALVPFIDEFHGTLARHGPCGHRATFGYPLVPQARVRALRRVRCA